MNKRDLKADLEAIREGATLFGDPNLGVNTQYELYEVAEHAIERALKAEALAQKLLDVLGRVIPRHLVGRLELDLDSVLEANGLLKKAKEAGDGIEDAIQRGLGIQKYWQVYLLMVITEDDIETRFIISDRGSERIEEKAASEHPSARVVVQWVGEIKHEYDIFGA